MARSFNPVLSTRLFVPCVGVYTAFSQANNSPALADPVERRMSRSYTDPQLSSSAAAPYRAEATYLQENRDDSSAGSGQSWILH